MRAALACLATALAALVAGCGGEHGAPSAAKDADPRAHFAQITETPEATLPATGYDGRYLVARVEHATWLRAEPDGRRLRRLGLRTEFGSPVIMGVVERRDGWLRVVTPRLPNHRTAWVREDDVRLNATDYSLVVDRSAHRLFLRRAGQIVHRAVIAVGRPGNDTPLGRFAVTDKLRPSDPASPYGCCAIALSGHQTRLEPGWPGGDRLAIHGTPATWSIGLAVSLGCMRAHDHDLRVLLQHVPLGAPVFIRA